MLILFLLLGLSVNIELKFEEEIIKLEQTQLGKTFLDTVQIAVRSKEPLDRVFQILRDQAQSYETEFLSIDQKHKTFSAKCIKDLNDFDNYAALLKARIMDMQQALDDKVPEKNKKVNTLQNKKKEKSILINRIDEIQQNREKQKCVFESRLEEHQTAISAVVAVREIFESALYENENGETAFIQLQEDDVDKITNLLGYASLKAGDFKHLQGYSSLFAVMEQLKVGQISKHEETVRQLVETCNDLENYIDIARSLLRSVDDIRDSYFQRLFKNLNQDLRDVNAIIEELESDVNVLEAQIKVLSMDRDEAVQKQENKIKQRGDRSTECEQEDSVYQFKLQENQRERETIHRILTLCLENVKELKHYIKKRGDEFQ
ncbi:unnamed protein product [Paramecium sonneborni]|uniref:Uncharacterized protein n=1 Tax=Paramecium sonneborni TaxID=65129 RepID=A0A8S1KTJ6_9CILI|nr:unnamed protein product [Paramecium sonneborni]